MTGAARQAAEAGSRTREAGREACSETGLCASLKPAESIFDTLDPDDLCEETVHEEVCTLVDRGLYDRVVYTCAMIRTFADVGLLDDFNRCALRLILNDVVMDDVPRTREALVASAQDADRSDEVVAPATTIPLDAEAVEKHAEDVRARVASCISAYEALESLSSVQIVARDLIANIEERSRAPESSAPSSE